MPLKPEIAGGGLNEYQGNEPDAFTIAGFYFCTAVAPVIAALI